MRIVEQAHGQGSGGHGMSGHGVGGHGAGGHGAGGHGVGGHAVGIPGVAEPADPAAAAALGAQLSSAQLSSAQRSDAEASAEQAGPTAEPGPVGRILKTAGAYLALTKPRVIELLLVATIPAMLLANRTLDEPKSAGALALLVLSTLFGGWLGAASANTLNCVIDADIDKVMKRTVKRPLVSDAVSMKNALVFGLVMGVASFLWLGLMVNWLSAVLIVITIAFYVLVYTKVLKRRTAQNVVWGGAAGCMPVMIGWAGVTGTIGWEAVVMFLVIFFWTPPHTWALGMKYRDDYEAAGVPMLPVVAPPAVVTHRIVLYTIAMVVTSLFLIPATGLVYAISAVLVGAWFLTMAIRLHIGVRNGAEVKPLKLFIMSNNYLAALFLALAVDSVLKLTTVADLLS